MMRRYRLELLLILSAVLLVGQLAWPAASRWWRRPRPGTVGLDQFDSASGGLNEEFLVYLPSGYGSGTWPLVVYLHGASERGTDPNQLRSWGPFAAMRQGVKIPAIVVGPQCRPDSRWKPVSIMRLIEDISSRYDIDRERIYLIGFSMGAYGSWETAAAYPDVFAAMVPICGGGNPDQTKSITNVPVWAFHGDQDKVVPMTASEQMISAARAAGGTAELTILPGAGHRISNEVCQRPELWRWLLRQSRKKRQSIQRDSVSPAADGSSTDYRPSPLRVVTIRGRSVGLREG